MDYQLKTAVSTVATAIIVTASLPLQAAEGDTWKFELTPYIWGAGVDADVEVANRSAEIDASFNDIADNLDMTAAFLATAQYNAWVTWLQVDYLDLSSDLSRVSGNLESKLTMMTLGFGYQFQGWKEGQTFDVLLGVRNLKLDNELELDALGDFSGDRDVTDGVIILRPSLQLSERWRFNPTLSYGGGDSESTYELQPQFQFHAWENAALRFGYRKLGYDIESSRGNTFDGAFQGPFLGIGMMLGSKS